MRKYALDGLVNMVGGCCGTTPKYTKAIAEAVKGIPRRAVPAPQPMTMLSGLTEFFFRKDLNFVNVGERCNIAGSIQFKKLIMKEDYEGAMAVAKAQVENGAQILDINLDDGLIDGKTAMRKFVRLALSDPDIANLPLMIDSSKFDVVVEGLKNC